MRRRNVIGILLAAGLGIISGCHRTVDSVHVGERMPGEFQWVQTDTGLAQIARVLHASKDRVNGLLKVQVEVMNMRKHDERIVYKWQWLDARGMEITSLAADWTPLVINGKEAVMITAVAPDARAVDARLKLQENIR